MRTFLAFIFLLCVWVAWMLHKPIPHKTQAAREFTDAEIIYLESTFNYAMDHLQPGSTQDWSVAAVNGRIAAGEVFSSTQKASCRNYVEISRTSDAQKVESGIACRRDAGDGWCRVGENDSKSCALEVPESMLARRARFTILQGNQLIDSVLGTRVNVDTRGLVPKAPNISAPSIGSVEMPKSPDIDTKDFRIPMPWESQK